MRFSAEKMLERIAREGRLYMVDDSMRSIMEKLDGRTVKRNNIKNTVFGAESYTCTDSDGEKYYINKTDCVV